MCRGRFLSSSEIYLMFWMFPGPLKACSFLGQKCFSSMILLKIYVFLGLRAAIILLVLTLLFGSVFSQTSGIPIGIASKQILWWCTRLTAVQLYLNYSLFLLPSSFKISSRPLAMKVHGSRQGSILPSSLTFLVLIPLGLTLFANCQRAQPTLQSSLL